MCIRDRYITYEVNKLLTKKTYYLRGKQVTYEVNKLYLRSKQVTYNALFTYAAEMYMSCKSENLQIY